MSIHDTNGIIAPRSHETHAIYAGSFDPITLGHLNIIEQAATVFNRLDVVIAVNPDKAGKGRFPEDERLAMVRESVADLGNVAVDTVSNEYVVSYAQRKGYTHLVRGLRDSGDFLPEKALRHINQDIAPRIGTVLLMCDRELAEVSSSAVMGMVGPEGWEGVVQKYVPEFVFKAIKKQYEQKTSGSMA